MAHLFYTTHAISARRFVELWVVLVGLVGRDGWFGLVNSGQSKPKGRIFGQPTSKIPCFLAVRVGLAWLHSR